MKENKNKIDAGFENVDNISVNGIKQIKVKPLEECVNNNVNFFDEELARQYSAWEKDLRATSKNVLQYRQELLQNLKKPRNVFSRAEGHNYSTGGIDFSFYKKDFKFVWENITSSFQDGNIFEIELENQNQKYIRTVQGFQYATKTMFPKATINGVLASAKIKTLKTKNQDGSISETIVDDYFINGRTSQIALFIPMEEYIGIYEKYSTTRLTEEETCIGNKSNLDLMTLSTRSISGSNYL